MKQATNHNVTKLNSVDSEITKLNPVMKGGKRVKRGDNPTLKLSTVFDLCNYTVKVNSFIKGYRMNFEGFRELLNVVRCYYDTGTGLTKWAIYEASLDSNNTTYQSCFQRVDILESKGLLCVLSKTSRGHNTYIPTDKALKELSELLKD